MQRIRVLPAIADAANLLYVDTRKAKTLVKTKVACRRKSADRLPGKMKRGQAHPDAEQDRADHRHDPMDLSERAQSEPEQTDGYDQSAGHADRQPRFGRGSAAGPDAGVAVPFGPEGLGAGGDDHAHAERDEGQSGLLLVAVPPPRQP